MRNSAWRCSYRDTRAVSTSFDLRLCSTPFDKMHLSADGGKCDHETAGGQRVWEEGRGCHCQRAFWLCREVTGGGGGGLKELLTGLALTLTTYFLRAWRRPTPDMIDISLSPSPHCVCLATNARLHLLMSRGIILEILVSFSYWLPITISYGADDPLSLFATYHTQRV